MRRRIKFLLMFLAALFFYFFPVERLAFRGPLFEALTLSHLYMRKHIVFCLMPAFFVAGAISVFIRQASLVKYFGAKANKLLAYGVASVSGVILAVCSCRVLSLFSGIYKRGAGLGPAIAFFYSGPAINVMAIFLTARVLGWQMGLARAIGAIVFSVVIGFLMHMIFLKEENRCKEGDVLLVEQEKETRSSGHTTVFFIAMVGFLVFANLAKPQPGDTGFFALIHPYKWYLTFCFLAAVVFMSVRWFNKQEFYQWWLATLGFSARILPLLFMGAFFCGFLFGGRPGHGGLIPSWGVSAVVGGNSFSANFFASLFGAFIYFATLTEIPILYGLIGAGMGKGPAFALLLAGPALSLPSMLAIRILIGTKKTICYASLVVVAAAVCGMLFGKLVE